MATDLYTRMQGIADKLLTRFNQGVIEYIAVTPGAGPVHNPGAPVEAAAVVVKGVARAAKGSVLLEPNSLIKTGDLLVTTHVVAGITPAVGSFIRFGGVTGQKWRIIRFDLVPAAGIAAAWKIYVRRG